MYATLNAAGAKGSAHGCMGSFGWVNSSLWSDPGSPAGGVGSSAAVYTAPPAGCTRVCTHIRQRGVHPARLPPAETGVARTAQRLPLLREQLLS